MSAWEATAVKGRGLLCCPCIKSHLKVDNFRSTNKLNLRVRGMADSLTLIDVTGRLQAGMIVIIATPPYIFNILINTCFSIVVQMG